MSSSSDEVPIEALAARVGKPVSVERSQSPVPDWLSQYQSPVAARPSSRARSSSDSDILQVLSSNPGDDDHTAAGPQTTQPEADKTQVLPDLSPSDKPANRKRPPAAGAKKSPKKAKQRAPAVPTVATTLQRSGLQPAAQLASATEPASAPDGAELLPGEIPIMLPEKLPTNKYVVELEPAGDGADDLTGDAGAVGRMLVSGEGREAELRLDLKGVVYDAILVPCACSLAVVNISGTEAKVEALTSSFMQLSRVAGMSGEGNDGQDDNHFLWDDDDNYQVGGAGGDEAPVKKATAKRKASGDADAPPKKRKPVAKTSKGTAKKKAGKAKPRAKK